MGMEIVRPLASSPRVGIVELQPEIRVIEPRLPSAGCTHKHREALEWLGMTESKQLSAFLVSISISVHSCVSQ